MSRDQDSVRAAAATAAPLAAGRTGGRAEKQKGGGAAAQVDGQAERLTGSASTPSQTPSTPRGGVGTGGRSSPALRSQPRSLAVPSVPRLTARSSVPGGRGRRGPLLGGPLDLEQIERLAAAPPEAQLRLTQLLAEVNNEVARILSGQSDTGTSSCAGTAAGAGTDAGPSAGTPSMSTRAPGGDNGDGSPAVAPTRLIVERLCDRVNCMQSALRALDAKQQHGGRVIDQPTLAAAHRTCETVDGGFAGAGTPHVPGLSRLEDMLCHLESQVCSTLPRVEDDSATISSRRDDLRTEIEDLEQRRFALQADIRLLMKQKNELEGGISALQWCRSGLSMQLGQMQPQASSSSAPNIDGHDAGSARTATALAATTLSGGVRAAAVGVVSTMMSTGMHASAARTAVAAATAPQGHVVFAPAAAAARARSASPRSGPRSNCTTPGAAPEDKVPLNSGGVAMTPAAPSKLPQQLRVAPAPASAAQAVQPLPALQLLQLAQIASGPEVLQSVTVPVTQWACRTVGTPVVPPHAPVTAPRSPTPLMHGMGAETPPCSPRPAYAFHTLQPSASSLQSLGQK